MLKQRLRKLKKNCSIRGLPHSVNKKLSNENFVSHAPEAVVARERKKKSDAEEKIAAIKASIEELRKK